VNTSEKCFYRDRVRSARVIALADAEGFQGVVHSLELIGQMVVGRVLDLGKYENALSNLANNSPLFSEIPLRWPGYHNTFSALYKELRQARNDAVHQGSHARTATSHAVELTMIIEDSLMSKATTVSQFMVRDVVEAKLWHPISYVRQQMLTHAFSFLPVLKENTWWFVAEYSLARYLRSADSQHIRKKRLGTTLCDAIQEKGVNLLAADTVLPECQIDEILDHIEARPILVVDCSHEDVLVGVLTSSDIL
jgi:predicted transcriptional regulator